MLWDQEEGNEFADLDEAFDRRAAGCGIAMLALAAIAIIAALVFEAHGAEKAFVAPMPQPAGPVTFAQVTAAAIADARSLPPAIAAQTRYLDARHVPATARRDLFAVVSYHVNGLSREVKRIQPRQVTAWLWAVRLDDYRWDPSVWEKLADVEPYYAIRAQVQTPVVKQKQVVRYDAYGRPYYATEQYTEPGKPVESPIAAPWLPAGEVAGLVQLTGSKLPIVRADWFVVQTAAQVDRAAGYYDWLVLDDLAAAEKLAALDRAKAIEVYREMAAIVPVSGVTPNNRQLFRFETITGCWWESRDVKANVGERNAVSHLLDDFKVDAFEIVFTLPNGLPAYFLVDGEGQRQESAPDFIASDHRSTNNDRRVHVGYSCVACHVDAGLRPIRDYGRKIYNPETGLALGSIALDPAKARRLEAAYLGPLDRAYQRDVADFAEAIQEVSGLKPAELAKAFESAWSRYLDDPVTLERAAAEAGLTPADLQQRLREYAKTKGIVDPVLAVYLTPDPPPVRREHFEERFPLLMLITQGVNP